MIMVVDIIVTNSINSSRGHVIDNHLRYDIALLRLSTETILNAHVQLAPLLPPARSCSMASPATSLDGVATRVSLW